MQAIALSIPPRVCHRAFPLALCVTIGVALAGFAAAQTPTPRQQLNAAAELVVRFEFDQAIDAFTHMRDQLDPGDPVYREATFGLAVALQHRTPPLAEYNQRAADLYRELADSAQDDIAARSLLNLGRILELRDFQGDPIKPDEAAEVYDEVITQYPDQPITHEAAFRYAGALIQQYDQPERVQAGVDFLEGWLDDHPDNPFAGGMHLVLYDHYREDNQNAQALRHLVEGDAVGLPVPRVGEYYWQAGELAREFPDQLDTAVRFYTKTVVETPSSGRAYQALDRLRALAEANPDAGIEIPDFVFGRAAATREPRSE